MTRLLKRPADAVDSLLLPIREAAKSVAGPSGPPARSADAPPAPPVVDPAAVKAELDALRAQAFREGLAQGRAQAQEEARAASEREAHRWREAAATLESALLKKLRDLEPMGVAIAFEAAAAVLGQAQVQPDGVVHTVRRLLEAATGSLRLEVHLAPAQLDLVRKALSQDLRWQHSKLKFETDASLAPGECRVVSERGQLETSLAIQLQSIQDSLLQTFARRQASVEAT